MSLQITKEGARVLRSMIVTCGSAGCFDAMKALDGVFGNTSLLDLGLDENGNWRMSVFQRLKWYASDNNIEIFEKEDIIKYFGGDLHINIMERIAHKAGLGSYLGADVGLVTHVLLPLEDGKYNNGDLEISFRNTVLLNSKSEGKPFYHLGAVVYVDIEDKIINEIFETHRKSESFMNALKNINGKTIELPKEYLKGLNCTANKSKKLG